MEITTQNLKRGGAIGAVLLCAVLLYNGRANHIAEQDETIAANDAYIAQQISSKEQLEGDIARLQDVQASQIHAAQAAEYDKGVAQGELAHVQQLLSIAQDQRQQVAANVEQLMAKAADAEKRAERAETMVAQIAEIEAAVKLLAPSVENEGVIVHTIHPKWELERVHDTSTGLIIYPTRRGQVTVNTADLDPQGQTTLAECNATGKCLSMTGNTLLSHVQQHTTDEGITERKTNVVRLVDWDARLVFTYYTQDTGNPVMVYTFSELANGDVLHAQADEYRAALD